MICAKLPSNGPDLVIFDGQYTLKSMILKYLQPSFAIQLHLVAKSPWQFIFNYPSQLSDRLVQCRHAKLKAKAKETGLVVNKQSQQVTVYLLTHLTQQHMQYLMARLTA